MIVLVFKGFLNLNCADVVFSICETKMSRMYKAGNDIVCYTVSGRFIKNSTVDNHMLL